MKNEINRAPAAKKNVVLIGATGFVGSALLNELVLRGHKTTAIVRDLKSVKVENPLIEYVVADATNPAELAQIAKGKDAVISLTTRVGAIRVSTKRRWRTIRRLWKVPSKPACVDC